ncbi:MAG: MFS transporter, partial [Xanthomonadaceae bacterium]|nr:MFS transporter [Xanthomonadaceae bacterium]
MEAPRLGCGSEAATLGMAQPQGSVWANAESAAGGLGWPNPSYAWYVLFLLILIYAVATLDRVVIGLLVDSMQRDLALSDTGISLLIGLAFALLYTVLGLPVGILVDRYRRVPVMVASLLLFSVATSAFGLATTF